MAILMLKFIGLFLIVLLPLIPVRRKKNNKQIKAMKKADTALFDYAVGGEWLPGKTGTDIKHK